MAKNKEIFFTKEGRSGSGITTSSGGGSLIFNAGIDGSKLMMLNVASIVNAPDNIELYIDGNIVANLKTGIVAPGDDLMQSETAVFPKDRNGNPYMNIPAGVAVHLRNLGTGTATIGFYVEDY